MDVRDMSKPDEPLANALIGSPVQPPVILTRDLEALSAKPATLYERKRAAYVPGLVLATGKSVFPHDSSDASFDLSTVLVEVSNGNGINGMAEALSSALKRQRVRVWRITNAEQFDTEVTQVFYVDGHRNEAMALAAMLPGKAEVEPSTSALINTQIRIVVGHNIRSLEEAEQISTPTSVALSPSN